MRWGALVPTLRLRAAAGGPPDVLVVQLGENDLGQMRSIDLRAAASDDLRTLAAEWRNTGLLWSDLLERRSWRGAVDPVKVDRARQKVTSALGNVVIAVGGQGLGSKDCPVTGPSRGIADSSPLPPLTWHPGEPGGGRINPQARKGDGVWPGRRPNGRRPDGGSSRGPGEMRCPEPARTPERDGPLLDQVPGTAPISQLSGGRNQNSNDAHSSLLATVFSVSQSVDYFCWGFGILPQEEDHEMPTVTAISQQESAKALCRELEDLPVGFDTVDHDILLRHTGQKKDELYREIVEEMSRQEMISRNETFTSVPDFTSYLLGEWTSIDGFLILHMVVNLTMILAVISITVPFILTGVCYTSAFFVLIYQKVNKLSNDYSSTSWDNARLIIAHGLTGLGKILHGYEIHGTEKIPQGPGLIVYYHGAIPIDYSFFFADRLIKKGQRCYSVVDHFLFRSPGLKTLLRIMNFTTGPREECLNILKNGNLLGISPGGVREALFSNRRYKLLWGKRTGFAQLAIDAKVAIIPMFTENVRDGYRTLGYIWPLRWLYERTRLPLVPIYGFFPVKFRTHIGEPIPYDPNITSDELAKKTKIAIEALIRRHQKKSGNVITAILDRFHKQQKPD
uniref:transmembrane protein 68-like n=1 Tax=Euleptes europaea TaxID=460621 RepID=UPI00253FCEDE|nr:transmembrane protein 68-like [Euleptes europaea]